MAISLTSNGITSTSTLAITNNSVSAESIDTLGNVIQTQRPAFKQTGAGSTGTGAPWSGYTNPMTNNFNQGSHFNATNGRFTAPITGIYHFDICAMTQGSSTDSRLSLAVNGTQTNMRTITISNSGNAHSNYSYSVECYLTAGDYVQPWSYSGSQAHTDTWNAFSGYFVGTYG